MKNITVAASLFLAGLSPALAAPTTQQLLKQWYAANGDCRGRYPDDPRMQKGCDKRDVLDKQLAARKMCYGKEGQAGYQMTWHICTRNSIK